MRPVPSPRRTDDDRLRRPAARPAPAPTLASSVLALQRQIGNRAVAEAAGRRLQRLIQDPSGTTLNPRASTKRWKALDPDQRTRAREMMTNPYSLYVFADLDAFFTALTSGTIPKPSKAFWRKSANSSSTGNPLGKPDPLFDYHSFEGTGGLLFSERALKDWAPMSKFGKTVGHVSNWASFVQLHADGAEKRLLDAGELDKAAEKELKKLRNESLDKAAILDRQEVTEDEELLMSVQGHVWASVAIEQNVNAMWELVATRVGVHKHFLPQASVPRWGQLHMGMGTRVSVTFTPGTTSRPAGSAADTDQFSPPWLRILNVRRTLGDKSLYVEGHLLNDNLGGPAAPYNLVPLTDLANAAHLKLVETHVKNKVTEMHDQERTEARHGSPDRNPIVSVTYSVKAKWGHPRRKNTQRWIDAFNALHDVLDELPKVKPTAYDGSMSVATFRDHLKKGTFAAHTADGHTIDDGALWDVLQPALNAVAPDRTKVSLTEALRRIDIVSDLWEAEEKYVPKHLTCNASTLRANGDEDESGRLVKKEVANEIAQFPFTAPVRV